MIDGVLYGTTPDLQLFALDADTGLERWRFDPATIPGVTKVGVNRGSQLDRRHPAAHLLREAIGARHRRRHRPAHPGLRSRRSRFCDGLGRDVSKLSQATTPRSSSRSDHHGHAPGEGPARRARHIRAFNVRTGASCGGSTRFRVPARPATTCHPTPTNTSAASTFGPASRSTSSAVRVRPTGSAAFDFWAATASGRISFANCLIASTTTGRRAWHYQFVRHDLWDRDLPAAPDLLTVTHAGQRIDAVAQTTKSGHVFVFNRETGQPLFPIEEIVAPKSDVPGESAWPTQPLPLKPAPFARQLFTHAEITNRSPEAHRAILEKYTTLRPHVPFMPPSLQGTVILPGFDGGAEWGGAATDPDGILYVNANEMAWILTLVDAKTPAFGGPASGPALFTQICAACHVSIARATPRRMCRRSKTSASA